MSDSTLPPSGPTMTHPDYTPTCPACAEPSTSGHGDELRGIRRAHYLCANGHMWLTKWWVG